jgi:DNA-binding MarR family transcriptional regulator
MVVKICAYNHLRKEGSPLQEFDEKSYIAEVERLFRRINYIIFRKSRNVLSEFGITPPQFSTLSTVSYHDGITMGELCDHLYLTSATVTGLVDRLEERNLVLRERDTDDRRVIRLRITPLGRDVLEKSVEARRAVLVTYVEGLTMDEKADLIDLLRKLLSNLTDRRW